jgi:putative DNA primase/helicase
VETEKRLIGAALDGRPIIPIDNCSGVITGDFMCQVTERPLMSLRALGGSGMKMVGNAFSVLINGNNVVIADDMVRRVLKYSMDADMEDPETRTFKRNPLAEILADRGKFVAAVLTVCRAYIVAGRPGKLPPLLSFEPWSDLVRSALVWLDRRDPVLTISETRQRDPVRSTRANVFDAWTRDLGNEKSYQASEIISSAGVELRTALLELAGDYKDPTVISSKRLGKWLVKTEKNISDGQKLVADRSDLRRLRWRLRSTKPEPAPDPY